MCRRHPRGAVSAQEHGRCFVGGTITLDVAPSTTKIAINSAALQDPTLIPRASDHCGRQCLVLAIDAKRVGETTDGKPRWEVFSHGGRRATGRDAVAWAAQMTEDGAGEILLTSMDRDGTKIGFNLPLTRAISDAVEIPVIASGGVGNLQHLADGVLKGGADAVLAASIFHFGEYTIGEAKAFMQSQGIEVRC